MSEPKKIGEELASDEAVPEPGARPSAEQSAERSAEERAGAEPSAAEQAATVEAELDELGKAKQERDEYLELAQRTRADFENYRKRAAREAEEARGRGQRELAAQLLPVVDNLERAVLAEGLDPNAEPSEAQAGEGLVAGVLLIYRELRNALERAGVEAYDPTGEPFDPMWHDALQTRAAEGTEPGRVLETLEKGYRLNGQALRPARVVVSE